MEFGGFSARFGSMSDALSENGSEQNDSQEELMTPVELIAKLEEVF